jgi:hypothetical protein
VPTTCQYSIVRAYIVIYLYIALSLYEQSQAKGIGKFKALTQYHGISKNCMGSTREATQLDFIKAIVVEFITTPKLTKIPKDYP